MRTSRCLRGAYIFAVFLLVEAGCTLEIYEQTLEICGNARIDPGEVCDDGNTVDGDGCSHDCKSNETCGNRIADVEIGEVCDDGNTVDGDGCSANCKSNETCGNGIVDRAIGEQCDDGLRNGTNGDLCKIDCTLGP